MRELAKQLIDALKAEGFTIQRYNSYSTRSIYLKLDYGVSNSIRISDHKGKDHLSYRFNLLTHIEESYITQDRFPRYFYPAKDVKKLITEIIQHRDIQQKRYGLKSYQSLMDKNRVENADKRGFWKEAFLV